MVFIFGKINYLLADENGLKMIYSFSHADNIENSNINFLWSI